MTYEETLEAYRESVSLGFSPRSALEDLENFGEADLKALDELRDLVRYGI